jgi:hypothetical protein
VAGESAGSGLRFFLDRGLGAIVVPGALRAAGWALETMDERYGADQSQNIRDTQWVEEATLAGDVLLCKDLAIAQNPLEAQAVYMTSARVFALSNAAITDKSMAQWYLDNEARIVKTALRAKGPYVTWRSTRPMACAAPGWLIRRTDFSRLEITELLWQSR